jgi:hypothetical protein
MLGKAGHYGLYAFMTIMPTSGILMGYYGGMSRGHHSQRKNGCLLSQVAWILSRLVHSSIYASDLADFLLLDTLFSYLFPYKHGYSMHQARGYHFSGTFHNDELISHANRPLQWFKLSVSSCVLWCAPDIAFRSPPRFPHVFFGVPRTLLFARPLRCTLRS